MLAVATSSPTLMKSPPPLKIRSALTPIIQNGRAPTSQEQDVLKDVKAILETFIKEKHEIIPSQPRPCLLDDDQSRGGSKKKTMKKESAKPKDVTSAVLFAQAREWLLVAANAEQKACAVFSTFERILGAALKKKGQKINELLRDWDSDGKGEIKKIAFRQKVRGNLGIKAENCEIDAFFNSMDADKGGSLDLAELKVALKSVLDAASRAETEALAHKAWSDECRAKAAQTDEAARATEAAEKAELELGQLETSAGPPDVQLGALIIKRNLKIGDLVSKWDVSGDGLVDRGEFRKSVKELGVKAEDTEIDALFDSLDSDGSGELDVAELKELLTRLKETAQQESTRRAEIKVSTLALRKAASKLQQVLRTEEEAKAKAELEAKEAAERQAAAKAEEERQATEEKAKARAMAAMKMAEEKAAYEAKLQERRNSTSLTVRQEAEDTALAELLAMQEEELRRLARAKMQPMQAKRKSKQEAEDAREDAALAELHSARPSSRSSTASTRRSARP